MDRLADFKAGTGYYGPKPAVVDRPRAESPIDALDAIRAASDVILDTPVKEFQTWLRRHPKQALRALDELDDALQALQLLRQSFERCV